MAGELVSGRRELSEFYDSVCSHGYRSLRRSRRLDSEQNLLKSFLVEAHAGSAEGEPDPLGVLTRATGHQDVDIQKSNDPSLINIVRGDDVYHLDALHARYWVIHTNASSRAANTFIRDLTTRSFDLDVAWLSADLMADLSTTGDFMGFGSEFDPDPVFPEVADEHGRGLTVSVRRVKGSAGVDLRKLMRPEVFGKELGISSMRLRYGEQAPTEDFAIADITHAGRFTERGPSFSAHQAIITRAISIYEQRVRWIESEFSLGWLDTPAGARLTGKTIGVRFSPVSDLEPVLQRVFSGAPPFRLWGLPLRVSESQFTVHASDLHVACDLAFDISNGFIRVYLREGGCGNTVTRLFTNVQRHLDSRAVLVLGENELAFGSPSSAH